MAKKKSKLADKLNLEEVDETPVVRNIVKSQQRPVRRGKKQIGGYFDPSVHDTLSELSFKMTRHEGRKITLQALLEEAIGDLIEKHKTHLD